MHRQELLALLAEHQTRFNEESGYIAKARDFVIRHENCFDSELLPAHVTGSAWVVNPDRSKALLMHHRKIDQWFQPGGHADGDADIRRVALRETHEETGLDPSVIRLVDGKVFDVDMHTVHESRHGPRHIHYDVRFLLEVDDTLPVPGNDESHEILWIPLYQVSRYNNNRSTYRMVEKTRRLR